MPNAVAVQTFGDRINFHPHLHILVTEGGVDRAGIFHRIAHLDDSRLAEIFAREVLALLVGRGLLSQEWAERILSWRHTGFNVHSRVRARAKPETERVGKYMVRYYGLYANAHGGKVKKANRGPVALGMIEEEPRPGPSKGWAEMIRKIYEVDPLICPRRGGRMRVVAFLTEYAVDDRSAQPYSYGAMGEPAGDLGKSKGDRKAGPAARSTRIRLRRQNGLLPVVDDREVFRGTNRWVQTRGPWRSWP